MASACGCARNPLGAVREWAIVLSYEPQAHPVAASDLQRCQMVIVDPDSHPPLDGLGGKTIVVAYVSLGEAEEYRSYWPQIAQKEWVVGANENWGRSHFVDVRSAEWRSLVLETVVPGVIAKGFRGIMMDTLDTADFLESKDPARFGGSRAAMAGLVHAIRERYPDLLLISNNGFALFDKIGPCLSGALTESVFRRHGPKPGEYSAVSAEDADWKISRLTSLAAKTGIPVFAIDYVSLGDVAGARDSAARLKALGFRPYIAERELNRIYRYE